jgi:hypothetical protein
VDGNPRDLTQTPQGTVLARDEDAGEVVPPVQTPEQVQKVELGPSELQVVGEGQQPKALLAWATLREEGIACDSVDPATELLRAATGVVEARLGLHHLQRHLARLLVRAVREMGARLDGRGPSRLGEEGGRHQVLEPAYGSLGARLPLGQPRSREAEPGAAGAATVHEDLHAGEGRARRRERPAVHTKRVARHGLAGPETLDPDLGVPPDPDGLAFRRVRRGGLPVARVCRRLDLQGVGHGSRCGAGGRWCARLAVGRADPGPQ